MSHVNFLNATLFGGLLLIGLPDRAKAQAFDDAPTAADAAAAAAAPTYSYGRSREVTAAEAADAAIGSGGSSYSSSLPRTMPRLERHAPSFPQINGMLGEILNGAGIGGLNLGEIMRSTAGQTGQPRRTSGDTARPDIGRGPALSSVRWARAPTGEDIARYHPDYATRQGVYGEAKLYCAVKANGGLEGCSVISESPEGYGFGGASLRLSHLFRARTTTSDGYGPPRIVPVRIRFSPPVG